MSDIGAREDAALAAVLDDFRRDLASAPLAWHVEGDDDPESAAVTELVRRWVSAAGHVLVGDDLTRHGETPRLWFPAVHAKVSRRPAEPPRRPAGLRDQALEAVLTIGWEQRPVETHPCWDACLPLPWVPVSAADVEAAGRTLETRARARAVAAVVAERDHPPRAERRISVVLCTYRRSAMVARALRSVATQTFAADAYEVLVVNNDPVDTRVAEIVAGTRARCRLRLVQCPFPGLSFARNAGIAQARGEVVSFLDDDAVAEPDWLAEVWRAFETHPEAGVVGGTIELDVPEPRPRWLKPGWEKFWGHRVPDFSSPRAVAHWWDFPWGGNWSARRTLLVTIGGFRSRYGRRGADFSGGEEIVAASLIRRLGHAIIVVPAARVVHAPELSRFTLRHVWKRALAARREQYRQQLDGYLPGRVDVRSLARGAGTGVRRALAPRARPLYVRLEHLMNACAEASLLIPLVRDQWRGRRRPVSTGV